MNKKQTLRYRQWAVLMLVGIAILALAPDRSSARSGRRSVDTQVHLSLALGHSQPISGYRTLAWSPDGRTLATGSPDHTVVLWDAATRRPRATLAGHLGEVYALVWSPDGKRFASSDLNITLLWDPATGRRRARLAGSLLASGAQITWPDSRSVATIVDRSVVLWDTAMGRRRATIQGDGSWIGHQCWSPDGKRLAIGDHAAIALWDTGTGKRRGTLADPGGPLDNLAWSPDGTWIAGLMFGRGEVILWDAATGRRRVMLTVPPSAAHEAIDTDVRTMAWSPDGKTLATGSYNGEVNLWDGATGERRGTLPGDGDTVEVLSWSPDGKTLAVQIDRATTLWDVATRRRSATLPDSLAPLAWRPDGQVLATAAGPGKDLALLWDGHSGRRIASLPFLLTPVGDGGIAWSPDGKTIAAGTGDHTRGTTLLWEAATGKLRGALTGSRANVSGLGWSPDGSTLASAFGEFGRPDGVLFDVGAEVWNRGSAFLWEAATGQRRAALPAAAGPAAWSSDGKTLATGGKIPATGPGVLLWRPDAAEPWATLPLEGAAMVLAWSPDGKTLATVERRLRRLAHDAWDEETLSLWDVATRQTRFSITRSYVGVFAWSPAGRTIATGGARGGIVLLDAATGEARITLPYTKQLARAAAWSPDSRVLATAYRDGSVRLWNAASGEPTAVLAAPKGPLAWPSSWDGEPAPRLAWSPDGRTLASSLDDHTIRLWDTAAMRCRETLVGHTGEIRALAWSPDGKTLATGSGDGSLRLWRAATGKPRAALYAIDQGREWVTVTPGGYFLASKNGAGFVQGHQGRRLLSAPELLKRFMRADVVRKALAD